jgi:uncharacterized repeat protein (TIGR01451 family)
MVLIGLMGFTSPTALASLSHTPLFPHIKVMAIEYGGADTPAELEFEASHYDLVIGSLKGYGDSPQFTYDNYYCVYVGNAEYRDMQAWAASHGVDLESFFIHYAEETEAKFGTESHVLPAGSRVPTYGWYGTGGDLTKAGARIVCNPGNPSYRAWKLDYLERQMSGVDGVFVDNTSFNSFIQPPTVTRGGAIAEYPTDPGKSYGNDLLTLFAEFKARFGATKAQMPNVSMYPDDPRVYPYVWGFYREDWNQPQKSIWYPWVDKNIADSTAAGVVANALGGFASEPRYQMAILANYYLVKNETCYFFPFLRYAGDRWDLDPRTNQWFEAVAYNVGEPKGPRYTLTVGIDPSSPMMDTMNATVTARGPGGYRLTDPTKNWTTDQWLYKAIVYPNGFLTRAYHSGTNWVDLYNPGEVATDGVYQLGTFSYEVLAREFDNALALFRPKGAGTEVGDTSAVDVPLPATADNPSGVYYVLTPDGTLDPTPRTSLSMRNTDGAILVKASKAGGTVSLTKGVTVATQVATYTIRWRNLMESVAKAVVVEDAIPVGTQYVPGSAEATGGRIDGARIIWELGDLAPGATGTVSFQVRLE